MSVVVYRTALIYKKLIESPNRIFTAVELARFTEVSTRTVYRAMDILMSVDLKIAATSGLFGGYVYKTARQNKNEIESEKGESLMRNKTKAMPERKEKLITPLQKFRAIKKYIVYLRQCEFANDYAGEYPKEAKICGLVRALLNRDVFMGIKAKVMVKTGEITPLDYGAIGLLFDYIEKIETEVYGKKGKPSVLLQKPAHGREQSPK